MDDLFYTNEFLKKLEPIIIKNGTKTIQKIKETLKDIAEEKIEGKKLENTKTKTSGDIFMADIKEIKDTYNIFWTKRDNQKIIITLTKAT